MATVVKWDELSWKRAEENYRSFLRRLPDWQLEMWYLGNQVADWESALIAEELEGRDAERP